MSSEARNIKSSIKVSDVKYEDRMEIPSKMTDVYDRKIDVINEYSVSSHGSSDVIFLPGDDISDRITVKNYEEYFKTYNQENDTIHKVIPIGANKFIFCGEKNYSIYTKVGDEEKVQSFEYLAPGVKMVNYKYHIDTNISIAVIEENSTKKTKHLTFQSRDQSTPESSQYQITSPVKLTSATLVLHEGYLAALTQDGLTLIDLAKVQDGLSTQQTDMQQIFDGYIPLDGIMTDMCLKDSSLYMCSESRNVICRVELEKLKCMEGRLQAVDCVTVKKLIVRQGVVDAFIKDVKIKVVEDQLVVVTTKALYLLDEAMTLVFEEKTRDVIDIEAFKVGGRTVLAALHEKSCLSLYFLLRGELDLIEKSIPLEVEGDVVSEHLHYGMIALDNERFVVYGKANYHSMFGINFT